MNKIVSRQASTPTATPDRSPNSLELLPQPEYYQHMWVAIPLPTVSSSSSSALTRVLSSEIAFIY